MPMVNIGRETKKKKKSRLWIPEKPETNKTELTDKYRSSQQPKVTRADDQETWSMKKLELNHSTTS